MCRPFFGQHRISGIRPSWNYSSAQLSPTLWEFQLRISRFNLCKWTPCFPSMADSTGLLIPSLPVSHCYPSAHYLRAWRQRGESPDYQWLHRPGHYCLGVFHPGVRQCPIDERHIVLSYGLLLHYWSVCSRWSCCRWMARRWCDRLCFAPVQFIGDF